MGGRTVLNLVLAATVIALAWLALRQDEQPPVPVVPMTSLARNAVTAIGIEATGHATVELERDGETWFLRAPLSTPADGFRVGALLGLAEARSAEGFRAPSDDLAQYGLAPPRAVVRFNQEALLIGDTDPVAHKRYVLVSDQVHMIDDSWFPQIFGAPSAWVDPRPLMGAQRVTSLLLPAAAWQLVDGHWQRTPRDPALSADAGTVLADAWLHARALAVDAYDETLEWNDVITIRVEGSSKPFEFRLSRGEGLCLLARPDLRVQYRFLTRQGAALLGEDVK